METVESVIRDQFIAAARAAGCAVDGLLREAVGSLELTKGAVATSSALNRYPSLAPKAYLPDPSKLKTFPQGVVAGEFCIAETGSVLVVEEDLEEALGSSQVRCRDSRVPTLLWSSRLRRRGMGHRENLLKDDPDWSDEARTVGPKVHDLVSFLEDVSPRLSFISDESSAAVTVHRFCQSGNVLGMTNEMSNLLHAAGVSAIEQAEPGVCCGFGGSTSITSPQVSEGIAERKLASLKAAGVGTVVTDNPGCVLHLRGAVDAAGVDMDVRHPAEILAERLRG